MNNSLIDIITGKERKRYNQIIQLIDQKNYSELFRMDRNQRFGLNNQKYIDRILNRIEKEVLSNPDFIIQMNQFNYHRANDYTELAIKSNPKIVERFIEENIWGADRLIPIALESGYVPTNEYINDHMQYFSDVEVMTKLIDSGYRPSDEIIEKNARLFSNEELLTRTIDWGFVPSLNFIQRTNLLSNPNVIEKVLDTIELTPELINSRVFSGNALAQQMIISKRPDLLLSLNSSNESYAQFWIEAFKQGHIPEEVLNNYSINGNYLLFSKVIKQQPEMVKYCKIVEKSEKEKIDELAICMGYVPTISDVQSSEYIKKVQSLCKH